MTDLTLALDTVRKRWRLLLALRISARALIAASLVAAGAALAERWLQSSDGEALALAALAFALTIAAFAVLAWPLRTRPTDSQIARFVEERCPDLDDAIVTAVEIQRVGSNSAFAPLVIQTAAARLGTADLSRCVDPDEIRMAAWRTAGGACALVLALVLAGPFIDRAAQLAYLRLFPASIGIQMRCCGSARSTDRSSTRSPPGPPSRAPTPSPRCTRRASSASSCATTTRRSPA